MRTLRLLQILLLVGVAIAGAAVGLTTSNHALSSVMGALTGAAVALLFVLLVATAFERRRTRRARDVATLDALEPLRRNGSST